MTPAPLPQSSCLWATCASFLPSLLQDKEATILSYVSIIPLFLKLFSPMCLYP